jgi:Tfp pilus assembly protein PilN
MIRINLLPAKRGRVSKKSLDFRNFLLMTGAGLAVVVLGGGVTSWIMSGRISSLERHKAETETQLTSLKAKAAEINGFEEDRKTFEEKIEIIARLKTDQARPVMFVDTLAHRIPERVWLIRLEEANGKVTITGRAVGNADIVEMIQQVKADDFLTDVQLVESRRIVERDLNAYEFTLTGHYNNVRGKASDAAKTMTRDIPVGVPAHAHPVDAKAGT